METKPDFLKIKSDMIWSGGRTPTHGEGPSTMLPTTWASGPKAFICNPWCRKLQIWFLVMYINIKYNFRATVWLVELVLLSSLDIWTTPRYKAWFKVWTKFYLINMVAFGVVMLIKFGLRLHLWSLGPQLYLSIYFIWCLSLRYQTKCFAVHF